MAHDCESVKFKRSCVFCAFGGIMRKFLETIYEKVRADHTYQSMEDLYHMSKEAMKADTALKRSHKAGADSGHHIGFGGVIAQLIALRAKCGNDLVFISAVGLLEIFDHRIKKVCHRYLSFLFRTFIILTEQEENKVGFI